MSLKKILCHDKPISILQKAYAADKIPHAYIFAGPEGVGKFNAAKQWAKLLLCQNPVIEKNSGQSFADSCNCCQSCQLLESDSHPDFALIYKELRQFTKDGKDKTTPVDLPIDVIREFLIEKVSARPTLSKRKVFIVREAEKLNPNSQNALLKVLEEPPDYCSVILLCTRTEKLLPTTKSRCQTIRFSPLDESIIFDELIKTDLDKKHARYFARLAQGSLGQAQQLAQLELADAAIFETKKDIINNLAQLKYQNSLDLAGKLLDQGKTIAAAWTDLDKNTSKKDINRKAIKIIIRIIISALHDAMKLDLTEKDQTVNSDQRQQIKKLASRFSTESLAEKITQCYQSMRSVDSAVNEKLIFEQLLLNLSNYDRMNS